MINERKYVKSLFDAAVEDEENLEVEEVASDVSYFYYWDNKNEYERYYYYDETVKSLSERIMMDEKIEAFLPKDKLAKFLLDTLDPNAIMCITNLCFVYDGEEESKVRHDLEAEYFDEYAYEIAGEDMIGQTWVERQIPVINVSNLVVTSNEISLQPDEYRIPSDIFAEGLLQTIYHECRHLFYECNEIVEIGEGTAYPNDGGLEDNVEDYGNEVADCFFIEFSKLINYDFLSKNWLEMVSECCKDEDLEY